MNRDEAKDMSSVADPSHESVPWGQQRTIGAGPAQPTSTTPPRMAARRLMRRACPAGSRRQQGLATAGTCRWGATRPRSPSRAARRTRSAARRPGKLSGASWFPFFMIKRPHRQNERTDDDRQNHDPPRFRSGSNHILAVTTRKGQPGILFKTIPRVPDKATSLDDLSRRALLDDLGETQREFCIGREPAAVRSGYHRRLEP